MSNRSKHTRRRGRAGKLAAGEVVAIQLAWARDNGALAEARQSSHDRLITELAHRRTSAVTWQQLGPTKALELLERMMPGADLEAAGWYATLRDLVIRHGGYLVVASASGIPPAGAVPR